MRRLLAGMGALLLLGGCSDEGGDSEATPESLGDDLGCDSFDERESEELYVTALYDCERDGATTSVYTFDSSSARDSWREIAEDFGTTIIDEGSTWLEVG